MNKGIGLRILGALAAIILSLGIACAIGCSIATQEETPESSSPSGQQSNHTPPQPEAGLIEFQQMKLTQLEKINAELTDLQVKVDEKKLEVEHLSDVTAQAMERIAKDFESRGIPFTGIFSMNLLTSEELEAHFLLPGKQQQLSDLQKEQTHLLNIKRYLENDIEETKQYIKLAEYYEFKLSQLKDLTSQLVVLRIDIDQGITGAQQEYNCLLTQRQFLQQDIEELEQLLEKD